MSNVNSNSYVDYVKCPFDPKHVMLKSHLQRHIIRCMVKHPDYVQCPHNAMHRFPTKEHLTEHINECPSKKHLCLSDYNRETEVVAHDVFDSRKFHLADENWDEN